MDPTGQLDPQPWMTDDATRAVIAALTAHGADVRFVGGCVRDAVARRPVTDVDIGTPDPPERVLELLETAGIRAVPTGIEHGTVTAVVGKVPFEITTLRLDLATDGRHARVAYTDSWLADAARRDFTINAMSCTPDGDIYDPFGGLADLGEGVVRFVGVPRERIEEDYLRLLRFFRFYASFGEPPPDDEALAACRQLAPGIAGLSAERVRSELFRILLAPNCADTLDLMRGEKILPHVVPDADNIGRLRMLSWLETTAIRIESVTPDPLRRLAAALTTDADGAPAIADRLKLSRRDRERLVAMTTGIGRLMPSQDLRDLHAALYRDGAYRVRDELLLTWAGEMALDPRRRPGRNTRWITMLETTETWTPPRFPLKGSDVTRLGVEDGPRVGELLAAVEAWWIAGDFTTDRTGCLEKLKERVAEKTPS